MHGKIADLEEKLQNIGSTQDKDSTSFAELQSVVHSMAASLQQVTNKTTDEQQATAKTIDDLTKQMSRLSSTLADVTAQNDAVRSLTATVERIGAYQQQLDEFKEQRAQHRAQQILEAEAASLKAQRRELASEHPDDVVWKFSSTLRDTSHTSPLDFRSVQKMDDEHALVFLDSAIPRVNCTLRFQLTVLGDPEDANWTGIGMLPDCVDVSAKPDKKGIVYWWHVRYNQTKLLSPDEGIVKFQPDFRPKLKSVVELAFTAVPHGHKVAIKVDSQQQAEIDLIGATVPHHVAFLLSKGDTVALL
eukprot:TRINITY_DN68156_c5_g1_i13.p1 TRINITY_DN68156_c5_g1~~TRINITY_DN68156_c5_g1_i13.p1  ORF type:complete len:303 (-),score=35.56 TRINITY_DN68156_c5_g1_i13:107-1015(-)